MVEEPGLNIANMIYLREGIIIIDHDEETIKMQNKELQQDMWQ